MLTARITLAVLGLLGLLLPIASSPRTVGAQTTRVLSDEDKGAIIKAILEDRLSRDGAADFEKYLVLEIDNLKPSMIPTIGRYQFSPARQKDLERKARRTVGGLDWTRFGDFEFDGQIVQIAFVRKHMGPGRPPLVRGKDYRYMFRRVDGRWQGKVLMVIC
jgi:hypothetical protein